MNNVENNETISENKELINNNSDNKSALLIMKSWIKFLDNISKENNNEKEKVFSSILELLKNLKKEETNVWESHIDDDPQEIFFINKFVPFLLKSIINENYNKSSKEVFDLTFDILKYFLEIFCDSVKEYNLLCKKITESKCDDEAVVETTSTLNVSNSIDSISPKKNKDTYSISILNKSKLIKFSNIWEILSDSFHEEKNYFRSSDDAYDIYYNIIYPKLNFNGDNWKLSLKENDYIDYLLIEKDNISYKTGIGTWTRAKIVNVKKSNTINNSNEFNNESSINKEIEADIQLLYNNEFRKLNLLSNRILPFKTLSNDYEWRENLKPNDEIDFLDCKSWYLCTAIEAYYSSNKGKLIKNTQRIFRDNGNMFDQHLNLRYYGWNSTFDKTYSAHDPKIKKPLSISKKIQRYELYGTYPNDSLTFNELETYIPFEIPSDVTTSSTNNNSDDINANDTNLTNSLTDIHLLYPDFNKYIYTIPRRLEYKNISVSLIYLIEFILKHDLMRELIELMKNLHVNHSKIFCTVNKYVYNMHFFFHTKYCHSFSPDYVNNSLKYLLKFSCSDSRDINRNQLENSLKFLRSLLIRAYLENDVNYEYEVFYINFAKNTFNNNCVLDMKLLGLKLLSNSLNNASKNIINISNNRNDYSSRFIDNKNNNFHKLIDMLNIDMIIENIFKNDTHYQLINASIDLLTILFSNNLISCNNMDYILLITRSITDKDSKNSLYKLLKSNIPNYTNKIKIHTINNIILNFDKGEFSLDELHLLFNTFNILSYPNTIEYAEKISYFLLRCLIINSNLSTKNNMNITSVNSDNKYIINKDQNEAINNFNNFLYKNHNNNNIYASNLLSKEVETELKNKFVDLVTSYDMNNKKMNFIKIFAYILIKIKNTIFCKFDFSSIDNNNVSTLENDIAIILNSDNCNNLLKYINVINFDFIRILSLFNNFLEKIFLRNDNATKHYIVDYLNNDLKYSQTVLLYIKYYFEKARNKKLSYQNSSEKNSSDKQLLCTQKSLNDHIDYNKFVVDSLTNLNHNSFLDNLINYLEISINRKIIELDNEFIDLLFQNMMVDSISSNDSNKLMQLLGNLFNLNKNKDAYSNNVIDIKIVFRKLTELMFNNNENSYEIYYSKNILSNINFTNKIIDTIWEMFLGYNNDKIKFISNFQEKYSSVSISGTQYYSYSNFNCIEKSNEYELLVSPYELKGIDFIWNLIIYCNNDTIVSDRLISNLILLFSNSNMTIDKKIDSWNYLINNVINYLKHIICASKSINNTKINNNYDANELLDGILNAKFYSKTVTILLDILNKLIEESEKNGTFGVVSHNSISASSDYINIKIKINIKKFSLDNYFDFVKQKDFYEKSNELISIKVPINITFWDFKKLVAKEIKMLPELIDLNFSNKNNNFSSKDNGKTLLDLNIKDNEVVQVFKSEALNNIPKVALILNNDLNPKLVEVLKEIFSLFCIKLENNTSNNINCHDINTKKERNTDSNIENSEYNNELNNYYMDAQRCRDFIQVVINSCVDIQLNDNRILEILQSFGDGEKLDCKQFISFYRNALITLNKIDVVWENLNSFNYRNDLEKLNAPINTALSTSDLLNKEVMPRYILAENQEYFDVLFSLQSINFGSGSKKENEDISIKASKILSIISTNSKIYNKILNLSTAEDYDNIFNFENNHLLYVIGIVEAIFKDSRDIINLCKSNDNMFEIINRSNNHLKIKWIKNYLNKKGFNYIVDLYIKILNECKDSSNTCKNSKKIASILSNIIKYNLILFINLKYEENIANENFNKCNSNTKIINWCNFFSNLSNCTVESIKEEELNNLDTFKNIEKEINIVKELSNSTIEIIYNKEDIDEAQNTLCYINQIDYEKIVNFLLNYNYQNINNQIEKDSAYNVILLDNEDKYILYSSIKLCLVLYTSCLIEYINSIAKLYDIIRLVFLTNLKTFYKSNIIRDIKYISIGLSYLYNDTTFIDEVIFMLCKELISFKDIKDIDYSIYFVLVESMLNTRQTLNNFYNSTNELYSSKLINVLKEIALKLYGLIVNDNKIFINKIGILTGYFNIIKTILLNKSDIIELQQKKHLLFTLINNYFINDPNIIIINNENVTHNTYPNNLIEIKNKENIDLIKTSEAKTSLFNLIVLLINQDSELLISLLVDTKLNNLNEYYTHIDSKEYFPIKEKKANGYVGLKNPSSVCYINSIIQQLYNVPSFRHNLMAAIDFKKETFIDKNNDNKETSIFDSKKFIDDNTLHQIQKLFTFLYLSERQFTYPHDFCYSFKDWDGNPTSLKTQQDSQEFLSRFFDNIESALKNTSYKYLIRDVFLGKICSVMKCTGGCDDIKFKFEDFSHLTLPIKDLKDLNEALQAFISEEKIEFYCDFCKKKVDLIKRSTLASLPNVLFVHLKRFEYNYNTFKSEKINSRLEFPNTLSLKNYTTESILNISTNKYENQSEDFKENVFIKTNDYYEYNLVGVNVHLGTAEAGHYKSYINVRRNGENNVMHKDKKLFNSDKDWMLFNDSSVTLYDVKKLEEDCFGGIKKNNDLLNKPYDKYGNYDSDKENSHNAYMLIYERTIKTPLTILEKDVETIKNIKLKQVNIDEHTNINKDKYSINNKNNETRDFKSIESKSLITLSNENYATFKKAYSSLECEVTANSRFELYKTFFYNEENKEYFYLKKFYDYNVIVNKDYLIQVEQNNNLFFNDQKLFCNQFNKFFLNLLQVINNKLNNNTDKDCSKVISNLPNTLKILFNIIYEIIIKSNTNNLLTDIGKEFNTMLSYYCKLIESKEIKLTDHNSFIVYIIERKERILDLMYTDNECIGNLFKYILIKIILNEFIIDKENIFIFNNNFKENIKESFNNTNNSIPLGIKIIDYLLSLFPVELSKNWTKMIYILEIIELLCMSDNELIIEYLILKDIIYILVDFVMNKESPYYLENKDNRYEIGNRHILPKLYPAISAISYICRKSYPIIYNSNDLKNDEDKINESVKNLVNYKDAINNNNTQDDNSSFSIFTKTEDKKYDNSFLKYLPITQLTTGKNHKIFLLSERDKEALSQKYYYEKTFDYSSVLLSKQLAHCMFNNFFFTKKKLFFILKQTNNSYQFENINKCFELLLHIIGIKDKYSMLRLEWVFGLPQINFKYEKVIENNSNIIVPMINNSKEFSSSNSYLSYCSYLLYDTEYVSLLNKLINKYIHLDNFLSIINSLLGIAFKQELSTLFLLNLPCCKYQSNKLINYLFELGDMEQTRLLNKYDSSLYINTINIYNKIKDKIDILNIDNMYEVVKKDYSCILDDEHFNNHIITNLKSLESNNKFELFYKPYQVNIRIIEDKILDNDNIKLACFDFKFKDIKNQNNKEINNISKLNNFNENNAFLNYKYTSTKQNTSELHQIRETKNCESENEEYNDLITNLNSKNCNECFDKNKQHELSQNILYNNDDMNKSNSDINNNEIFNTNEIKLNEANSSLNNDLNKNNNNNYKLQCNNSSDGSNNSCKAKTNNPNLKKKRRNNKKRSLKGNLKLRNLDKANFDDTSSNEINYVSFILKDMIKENTYYNKLLYIGNNSLNNKLNSSITNNNSSENEYIIRSYYLINHNDSTKKLKSTFFDITENKNSNTNIYIPISSIISYCKSNSVHKLHSFITSNINSLENISYDVFIKDNEKLLDNNDQIINNNGDINNHIPLALPDNNYENIKEDTQQACNEDICVLCKIY